MAFTSLFAAAALSITGAASRQQDQIDSKLVVQWYRRTATVSPPGFVFEHAQATFGPSILTCDKLTVDLEPDHKHMVAEGHVHILDTDGTLDADELDVDWIHKTGSAKNVDIMIGGFMAHAMTAKVFPDHYELEDLYATPCGAEPTPLLSIRAQGATVNGNGNARIFHPRFYVLGRLVLALRRYTISSNNKPNNGQPIPSVSYSKSGGFSGTWIPSLSLNDTTVVNAGIHLAQNQHSAKDLLITKSLLPTTNSADVSLPYPDFGEPFGYAYFENIHIPTPEYEHSFVSTRRETFSVGTAWNEFPYARREVHAFNKPVDFTYERADTVNGVGLYGQLRAQKVEQIGGPQENRILATTVVSLPPYVLWPRGYTDIRFDGLGSFGDAKPFGWGHMQAGLVARPNGMLRLGMAYVSGVEFGAPLFVTDRLNKLHSVDYRIDLLLGPHKLSAIAKYDPDGKRWYDTEFQIAQAMGCVEPYFVYRSFPRGYGFGLRLRLDNLVDTLKRRGVLKSGHSVEEGPY